MQKNFLNYRTPLRKQIEGIFLSCIGFTLFIYWFLIGMPLKFIGWSLLAISLFISYFGLYRTFSFYKTKIELATAKIYKITFHFGFFKKQKIQKIDNVTIFASDLYLFTWAIFAYKGDISPRQVMPEDRFIIIDSISRKKANIICEKISQNSLIQYRKMKK